MLRNRSSNQSNTNSEILEVVAQTELLRILECPVCKEVPFPPIFNCTKGHIICYQCKPKLTRCALCTASFSDGRNFAVETIIMSSKHSCKYKDFGCNVVLPGEIMSTHIRDCQYGCLQIPCHLGKYNQHNISKKECLLNLIPINKYMDHLKEKHMILRSISKAPVIIFESPTLTELDDTFWLGDYQIYDGETFIVRQFVVNKLIYFSLAVIADDEVAKKYSTTIKISSKKNKILVAIIDSEYLHICQHIWYIYKDKVCKVEWSVPVHSIQSSEDTIKGRFCGVAPISYVMNLSEIVLSHGKEKMVFQVEYNICILKDFNKKRIK